MNKFQYETYEFYETSRHPVSLRVVGIMNDPVDGALLDQAAQKTISRYPYFAVKVIREEEHYKLLKNDLPIVVSPLVDETPHALGTEESNYHLVNVDYEDRTIAMNMAHAITGGNFYLYFLFTLLYEYVRLRYDRDASPGEIFPADSSMLPGENDLPDTDYYRELADPVHTFPKNGCSALGDPVFLNEDGSLKKGTYYRLSVPAKEMMAFSRKNDMSPNAFLSVMIAKALDRILPPEADPISANIMQNYAGHVGVPNSRYPLVNSLFPVYPRSVLKHDYEFLGTVTRGQMYLQSDHEQCIHTMKVLIDRMDGIDQLTTFEERHSYAETNSRFATMPSSTFVITYPGPTNLGDLPRYMEGIYAMTAPRLFTVIITFGDRFLITYQQPGTSDKYLSEILRSFEDAGVPCEVQGPYPFIRAECQWL